MPKNLSFKNNELNQKKANNKNINNTTKIANNSTNKYLNNKFKNIMKIAEHKDMREQIQELNNIINEKN